MANNNLKNPFNTENWFSQIVARDQNVQVQIKKTYKQFLQNYSHPNLFMSFKNTYLQIVNAITKHAIVATLIMLVALGGVGASAAQLFAPENLKPSTILGGKKSSSSSSESSSSSIESSSSSSISSSSSSNSISNSASSTSKESSFKSDNENTVAVISECNLALKYKKLITSGEQYKRTLSIDQPFEIYFNTKPIFNSTFSLSNFLTNPPAAYGPEPEGINVGCTSDLSTTGFALRDEFEEIKLVEQSKVCQQYFLTNETCKEITSLKEYKYNNYDPKITRAITFVAKNVKYFLGASDYNQSTSDIQIHLDSLSPSVPSPDAINTNKTNTVSQTYTNPFFPDFKLVYDDSWKFETSTNESYIKGLVNRTIKLKKEGTEIKIITGIIGSGGDVGCIKSDDQISINDRIIRHNYADSVSYSPKNNENTCFNIKSNIDANKYPLFKEFRTSSGEQPYKNATSIEYVTIISTNNKNYLSEIDQIISQSSFK